MRSTLLLFALGLAVNQAAACETPGTYCSSWGDMACECNEGYLLECAPALVSEIDGEGGETEVLWARVENCPVPADGGLQCVDGACTS
ncbi:hypothetical protein ASPZODRAFT_95096 [Penicilliopsis zonata CBS 506.65]|uniref:EGF-like domain-containing protein n=1 Tax=Penicilliopsis zonata CBS 506.65 TaxID=1073090 RepID=A0A1L9SLM1_9EURO|nr:hypothetical protein ASPZODRAFT_95096 [Penicilliopsis zonata CBS 506.65]OJJ47991.1 hypothetical protein ASPZODRAFT_95096 [Penicilliopsis zonata CBS 506.65]